MPSASPDYGAGQAVGIVADALDALLAVEKAGRNPQPAADLVACPSVGIEPAAPFAEFLKIGRRELRVQWRVRVIASRWEPGPALALAVETYRTAAPGLRQAGFDVASLDAPTVARIAGAEYLLSTFNVSAAFKE
jgi:hypothetical protein